MAKFEKEFVHFMWDDSLKGKKVFFADDMGTLEIDVLSEKDCEMGIITDYYNKAYPFCISYKGEGESYKFVYYDPNYELKLAYEKGKKIQFKCFGDWKDIIGIPVWSDDAEYRIKPKGYRAFKNTDELKKKWEELCPTNIHRPSLCEPLIWVRHKATNSTSVIIRFAGTVVNVNFANYTLDELFRNFTFPDGTPCGIEE